MKADYDIVVIGFGKAGKTLAAKFSKAGKSVALIEKDKNMYGGTCINVGCIPSKRLITDAAKSTTVEFDKKIRLKSSLYKGLRFIKGIGSCQTPVIIHMLDCFL